MSKTTRFDIHSNAPEGGSTFQGNRTHAPAVAASKSQSKPKRSFGITNTSPQGDTFQGNKSHLNFPKASTSPQESKSKSSKTGHYSPSGPKDSNFPGGASVKGHR